MKITQLRSWGRVLEEEFSKPYFLQLQSFLESEQATVYPPEEQIFNAFVHTPFEAVKVVIVGQDPYHGPGQAEGMCFSVPQGVPFPPSLRNIFQELQEDMGVPIPSSGSLLPWAKQGVFLLNATLTVRAGQPLSHHGKGWELFTDAVIAHLLSRTDPIVFLLWGGSAKKKVALFQSQLAGPHVFLTAAHPSPLSAYQGFFRCRHFSKTNQILQRWGKEPIRWALP